MMEKPNTLRILMPSVGLESETCLLVGYKNTADNLCVITGRSFLQYMSDDHLHNTINHQHCDIQVLGIYVNEVNGSDPERLTECKNVIKLLSESITLTKTDLELPSCSLHGTWKEQIMESNIIVVIFNARDIHASCLLDDQEANTLKGQLYKGWQKGAQYVTDTSNHSVQGIICTRPTWSERQHQRTLMSIVLVCQFITSLLLNVCDTCSDRLFSHKLLYYLPRPAVITQVKKKATDLFTATNTYGKSKLETLRLTNVLWRQSIDVLLGVTVMYYLGCHSQVLASTLMMCAETVASESQRLLQWMMGVPAGLKLNRELAHFLGQFFNYHIYLWMGYLRFLGPLWKDAVWYISISGCMGLSIQLSLVQDLLSVMTLHSYCFYVYAARLYSLQVYALRSLWRLFRGKKWNPLFQRVDSSSYDVDQLFIGTLLFTILLFLLPTTGLFYTVFTGLRLLVLAVQGTLYKMVNILDSLPMYALYLCLLSPSTIAVDIRLHVLPRIPYRPLYHAIQLLPMSITRLFCLINLPAGCSTDTRDSWSSMTQKILTGKLIYPWIEPSHQ